MTEVSSKKFDLEERTTKFAGDIIIFAKKIPENTITKPLITQLVKSGTSIAANYCEADDAESKADFKHKIGICKKESRETKYWLKTIPLAIPSLINESSLLLEEARQLNLIFNSINNKLK